MMPLAQCSVEARTPWPFSRLLLLTSVALATCVTSPSSAQIPTPAGSPAAAQTPATTPAPPTDQTTVQGPPTLRLTGFTFTASADLSETYTSNAYGVGGSGGTYNQSDLVTSAGLSLAAHNHTLRFDGDMDLRLVGSYYANNPSFSNVYTYLNAVALAEIIPEHLQLQGTAFAQPILINNLGPLGANGRPVAAGPNSGLRDMYGYTVTPTFAFRLGDFATSTTTATQSSVFFVEPDVPSAATIPGLEVPTQSLSYGASQRIASGPDFFRLNWGLTGAWNFTELSQNLDLTSASATGDIKYALSREVVLLATLGYESITSNQPLSEDLVGPIYLGGLQLTLGPDFQMTAMAGQQFNSPSYIGNLTYRAGPFTTFTTSVTDTVTTPTGRLFDRSAQLGVNGQGNFIDTGYSVNPAIPGPVGSPVTGFDPLPIDGVGITNTIQRYRSVTSSLTYTSERTQYRLTGFATLYDTLTVLPTGFPSTGRSRGGDFAVFRTMTPQLTGGFDLWYAIDDTLGGQYKLFRGTVNAEYSFSPRTSVFLTGAYIARTADDALVAVSPSSADTSDTSVTIGIRRTLY